MPYDFPNRYLFANTKPFDEAGVTRPPTTYKDDSWTWDALRAAMEGLQRRFGGDGASFAFDGGRGIRSHMPWVWNNGGDMFSKDGREVVLNQPAGVEALQFFQDLMYKFRVAPPQDGRPDARKNFTLGKMLVYEDSQTIIGQLRSDIKGAFAWDVVPVPKGKGARAASGGGSGYAIANPATNKEEAWAYFKHLMSRQSQEMWMTGVGAMVPFKALVESPAFLQPPPDHMSYFVEGASLLKLDPTAVRWSDINPVLGEEVTKLWDGTSTAKQVADGIKQRVDPLLK
jgi:multiple sugar transport system substrate-binding protein